MGNNLKRKNSKHSQPSTQTDTEPEDFTNEIMCGTDKLYEVKQTEMSEKLHKNIVAIIWRNNFGVVGRGSGLLISPNLILTCAHNFYNDRFEIVESDYFNIYPGLYGTMGKPYKIQKYFIPEEYKAKPIKGNIANDYALIKLSEKVSSNDYICLKGNFKENDEQVLAVFGYPEEKYQNVDKENNTQSVAQYGLIKAKSVLEIRAQKAQIVHSVSTLPGHSGSPIVLLADKHGEEISVVGIHTGGITTKIRGKEMKVNAGHYLKYSTLRKLKVQAKQMGAQPFIISKDQTINEQFLSADEWIKIGKEHYYEKEYQNTLICFKKAVGADPKFAPAYYCLGRCLHTLEQKEQSIQFFKKAIQIDSNLADCYNQLGLVLFELNKVDEAIKNYKKCISLEPNNAEAHNNLGYALYTMDKTDQAIESFLEALKHNSRHEKAHYNLGNAFRKANNIKVAIEHYIKAVQINPDNQMAHNNLGNCYNSLKNMQQAIKSYLRVIELNPEKTKVYFNLGLAYANIKFINRARECFEKYVLENPDDENGKQELARLEPPKVV